MGKFDRFSDNGHLECMAVLNVCHFDIMIVLVLLCWLASEVVPRGWRCHSFMGIETMESDTFVNTQIVYVIVSFKSSTTCCLSSTNMAHLGLSSTKWHI